ncbi:uncharacterized protein [Anoplolepis gracilipes]|uniref:uncharacterized protein n=1 Tax=Anoplolepis gracilipes TaxID=354296 RepID=UPI003BA1EDF9
MDVGLQVMETPKAAEAPDPCVDAEFLRSLVRNEVKTALAEGLGGLRQEIRAVPPRPEPPTPARGLPLRPHRLERVGEKEGRGCSGEIPLSIKGLKMLLTELKPYHPDLPLDPRSIVQTPVCVNIKPLNNGSYIHVGIKQGLVKRMASEIKPNFLQLDIDINIDGLPVSKSSSVDVWPILGRCIGLYDQRPFVIGLFCGTGKPEPLDSYLKDFIDELKTLQNDACAYLKCIKHHSGYNGCDRCIQEGDHDGAKVCYDPKCSTARTDESFNLRTDENHHIGVSPLTQLSIKFVTQFSLCSMHLL